jgi:hypothetical protein
MSADRPPSAVFVENNTLGLVYFMGEPESVQAARIPAAELSSKEPQPIDKVRWPR